MRKCVKNWIFKNTLIKIEVGRTNRYNLQNTENVSRCICGVGKLENIYNQRYILSECRGHIRYDGKVWRLLALCTPPSSDFALKFLTARIRTGRVCRDAPLTTDRVHVNKLTNR